MIKIFKKLEQTNFRVKIIEINMTPEGIFAKGIPYQDRKISLEENNFNVKVELDQIQNLI